MNLENQLVVLNNITSNGFLHDFDGLNTWFGHLDADILYGFIRTYIPARIIEVGSGFSTQCSLIALADNALPYHMITIDPSQKRLTGLEHKNTETKIFDIIASKLEDIDLSIFKSLSQNDILFIDSSHIWEEGNDVDILYYRILPELASGVLVHIHDIFLPDEYPPAFQKAGCNEQEHVVKLLDSQNWQVLLSAHFLKENSAKALQIFPSYSDNYGTGSLWLEKL